MWQGVILLIILYIYTVYFNCHLSRSGPTFALHSLAKQTLEQPLAVLADGGTSVGVNGEGVGHLDPPQHHLLHPDGPAAPGEDPLPGLLMGPLLQNNEKCIQKNDLLFALN